MRLNTSFPSFPPPLRLIIVCPRCHNGSNGVISVFVSDTTRSTNRSQLFAALPIRIAIHRRPGASLHRSCWNVIVQGSTLSTSNSVYLFKLYIRYIRSLEFVLCNNRFRRQLIVTEILKFVYFCR